MNKKSDKQKQKDYTLSKIKKGLIEKHGKTCCICQNECEPDLMHILPKSIYPEHYLNHSNLVLGWSGMSPHLTITKPLESFKLIYTTRWQNLT